MVMRGDSVGINRSSEADSLTIQRTSLSAYSFLLGETV
jgi:hypothetical protein